MSCTNCQRADYACTCEPECPSHYRGVPSKVDLLRAENAKLCDRITTLREELRGIADTCTCGDSPRACLACMAGEALANDDKEAT